MPYTADLSSTGAHLVKPPSSIRTESLGTRLVGVGRGCQRGWPDDPPLVNYGPGAPAVLIRRHIHVVKTGPASAENLSLGSVTPADMPTFSAWSLLSLTVTAHGAPDVSRRAGRPLCLGFDRSEWPLHLPRGPRGDP